MGKLSVGKSIISRVISVSNIARGVSSIVNVSVPDVSSLASQVSGGKIQGVDQASIMSSIKSTPAGKVMDKIDTIKNSAPIGNISNVVGSVANSTPAKAMNDAITKAQGRANEFVDSVKDKVVDKIAESGIKDNPEVKNAANSVKSKLSDLGIDVNTYIEAYKESSND